MSELLWSVDALTIKEKTLFGFGWVFHPTCLIHQIHLEVSFLSAQADHFEKINVESSKPRTDVASAHPTHSHALTSGFVFIGSVVTDSEIKQIKLVCILNDGRVCEVGLPLPESTSRAAKNGWIMKKWRRLSVYQNYVKRALLLMKMGQWSSIYEKMCRHWTIQPSAGFERPSDLAQFIKNHYSPPISVMIDHDLGGGANHYRVRYIDTIVNAGGSVLVFTCHMASLTSVLILKSKGGEKRISLKDLNFFNDVIATLPFAEVVYNTAVSLPDPFGIASLLLEMKRISRARLKILVHDFYLVCPSHFLLNDKNQFCRIPALRECSSCLQANTNGFISLFPQRNMQQWRAMWGSVLVAADEIIAFSNNSVQLLHQAYPQISVAAIQVVPHKVDYLPAHIPVIRQKSRLHIGVVGQIGIHKGAHVVAGLAKAIKRHGSNVKITVFGVIEAKCDGDVLSQTGLYRQQNLPSLIEASDANVFLFPSICPETFSYVIQELMLMELPVAAFNFGAPAERLANYPRGMILDSEEPDGLLRQLEHFHQKIYTKEPTRHG
jgi:glycosyltransferase involved in cell wall biosynthesis